MAEHPAPETPAPPVDKDRKLPRLLSLAQAARYLQSDPADVLQAIADGGLPAVHRNGAICLPVRGLLLWLGIRPGSLPAHLAQEKGTDD